MKKIMYIAVLGILFLASAGHASAAWNTYPSDCPNPLSIGNYSTGQGIQDGSNGCWTRKSVSASAGQTINVAVYYDNTNSGDANNVSIDINQSPSGSMSSKNSAYSFSGNLSSSIGSLSLSQVTANLSSSETLTFSQAKWFKKGSSSGASLPSGQTGYEAFNGNGLSMGTIAKDDWGTILFSFSVGTTVAPQLCKDTSANNYNGALPCQYPSQLCKDTSASNYNGSLPCTYPPQLCKDTSASNYNGALPCQYPPKVCAINNFTTNTSSITLGGSVTLSWNTSNCNSVYISSVGSVSLSSSKNVSPLMTTDYDLTATGSNGNFQKRTIRVNVNQPAQLCKDPSASNYNGSLPCTYPPQLCKDTSASNYGKAIPCTYPPQLCRDSGASNYLGSLPCTYPSRICEDHTASNFGGSLPCRYPPQLCKDTSASNYNGALPCQYPAQLCKDPSASNYNGSLPCTYPTQLCQDPSASNYRGSLPCEYTVNKICSITSFTSDSTSITSGDPVTLSWDTENCATVSITNVGNNLQSSGEQTVYPTKKTTYTLTGNTTNGTKPTRSVTVNVSGTSSYVCSITNFISDSTSITSGDPVTLSWNTENCATVNISGVGDNLQPSGYQTVYPTKKTTYTLTGNGTSGTKPTRAVTVNVSGVASYVCSIVSFSANDTSVSKDDPVTLFWDTENCATVSISNVGTNLTPSGQKTIYPTKTITYTLTGNGTSGTNPTKSLTVTVSNTPKYDCSINDFTASDTSIEEGDRVTLLWETEDCDNVSISDIGDVDSNGSERIEPEEDTTYILTAYDSGSSKKTKTVRIYVDNNNHNNNYNYNDNSDNYNYIYNSSVITTLATNVSETAATLNGIVTSSNSGNANTYFEYGTSTNLGQRTNGRSVNGNSNISEYVTGLSSNTIYYFRAVSTGNNGTSRGSMEIFRTLGYNYNVVNTNTGSTNTQVIKYVTIPGTTVTGIASPIMLEITNRFEAIGKGDTIDYTVTYKNISKNTLTNSVLQVVVPKGITITNASKGTYSNDTHTLSVELNDLAPGEEGVVYVQGYVDSIPADQAKIVSTAILVYTSNSGAQENAIAYVLNVPKNFNNGNVLGASAFFSGFGGIGLIGWLLILILILLAVIIARSYSQRRAYVVGLNSLKK